MPRRTNKSPQQLKIQKHTPWNGSLPETRASHSSAAGLSASKLQPTHSKLFSVQWAECLILNPKFGYINSLRKTLQLTPPHSQDEIHTVTVACEGPALSNVFLTKGNSGLSLLTFQPHQSLAVPHHTNLLLPQGFALARSSACKALFPDLDRAGSFISSLQEAKFSLTSNLN